MLCVLLSHGAAEKLADTRDSFFTSLGSTVLGQFLFFRFLVDPDLLAALEAGS